jgi:aconitate hydratase
MPADYSRACTKTIETSFGHFRAVDLPHQAKEYGVTLSRLPYSLRVLLENLLRHMDGRTVTAGHVQAFAAWLERPVKGGDVAFRPARVLMQDFTGVPAVVDLAAMRDAMKERGGDPAKINPLSPVDLVIDHSVQVDFAGSEDAFGKNVELEMERNRERYVLLRSAQTMFSNFRVIPPQAGICHQVNLEYLAKVVWTAELGGVVYAYPDTLVGTDSHTTMINGLGVLGWGVGGIEAESAMLGQPVSMTIPEVVGVELTGRLPAGSTATDAVLTLTAMLRKHGVVGKFVEFFGPGLDSLSLADRATIANMAPEYGATCGFFPVDAETLRYLRFSGRDESVAALVEAYAKENRLWRDPEEDDELVYSERLALDLTEVEPCIAGPSRPQDLVRLKRAAIAYMKYESDHGKTGSGRKQVPDREYTLGNGDVVIAAITSCTNTSNAGVMLSAGLLARKAVEKGLKSKPWVKTSLAPGSQVVSAYLQRAGLQPYLDALGFQLVGYGCTTCIGNSGPLDPGVEKTIVSEDMLAAAVLSGNRNFEGRVHPLVKLNYLASPPLVVAYALAGNMACDVAGDPLGTGTDGKPVYLKDIWPSEEELKRAMADAISPETFIRRYREAVTGDAAWNAIPIDASETYRWDADSTYIKKPPYFENTAERQGCPLPLPKARILALFGDSVTTDHISPAGSISASGPAGKYLESLGVEKKDFNSYGARRGNDEVMARGTFANVRIKNEMVPGTEGGVTRHYPSGEHMSIYDAAMRYRSEGVPLVVVAGKDYGMGSSRDWAAKGPQLLGVKAVIAESLERIHRSNLVGMGILPLEFPLGVNRMTLGLTGREIVSLSCQGEEFEPGSELLAVFTDEDGASKHVALICRIDTPDEMDYYRSGGILHKVLRDLAA